MPGCSLSPREARSTIVEVFDSPREARTTYGLTDSPREARTTIVGQPSSTDSPRECRVRMFAQQFLDLYVTPTVEAVEDEAGIPASVARLFVGGTEITAHKKGLRVIWPRNGTLTWQASFVHETDGVATIPSPLMPPGSGSFADKIMPWSTDLSRTLTLQVEQAGETVTDFPTLLAGDPTFDGEVLEWGGTDLTPSLSYDRMIEPGDELDDIVYDGPEPVKRTAHAAIREVASWEDLDVSVRCNFPNYQMRNQTRATGSPLGWMDGAARPKQAARRWERSVLIYESARFDPNGGGYDWTFIDRVNIETLPIRSNADNVHNKAKCTRLEPSTSRVIGEAPPCSGGQCVGRTINIALDIPSRFVQLVGTAINGTLVGARGFDAQGNLAGTLGEDAPMGNLSANLTNQPMVRVDAIYRPVIGTVEYVPGYSAIQALGGVETKEQDFEFEATDSRSIADIGEKPDVRNIEDPAILRDTDAAEYARLVVEESVRRTWSTTLRTPWVNPRIRPGDSVRVIDYLSGTSLTWFVEQVSWDWPGNGDNSMELQVVRPWL